jgi:hypothetical protein
MKFGGDKFLYEITEDVDGYYFECKWHDMGVKIEKVIEQAYKDCKIPRDEIHVEVQPIDPQVKSADARVRGMSEKQLRCVCAYLHLHGWKTKV